jgi:hypothetical protein
MKAMFGALMVIAGFIAVIGAIVYFLGTLGVVDSQHVARVVETAVTQVAHRIVLMT